MSKFAPYKNGLEKKFAKTLGDEFQYEPVRLPYTLKHVYVPDFVCEATKTIYETKGRWTSADRMKVRAVVAQNPDYKLTMVFQRPDTPINKGSKTTYAMFCDKHGIAWSKA